MSQITDSGYALLIFCHDFFMSDIHWMPRPLGAFQKFQKATVSFVMSVRPSIHPSVRMEQLGFHWTDFHKIWYVRIFSKICLENSNFINTW
jgi:hypothetical protein